MLEHVHILTLTHRTAKLKAIGELVAGFEGDGKLQQRLTDLRNSGRVDEVYYASTCNRLLLLFTSREKVDANFISRLPSTGDRAKLKQLRHLRGLDAINHLYEVAASVDSLVIGERQILGQLRESYERCRQWGLIGDDLRIVFDQAVLAAKDVYANTRIGEKSVSVVSLAMRQLQRHAPKLSSRILLIGAGQTNVLVTKFLKKQGYTNITVANRTLARAEQLAAGFPNGRALRLSELKDYRGGFDVLFVCTAAAEPVVTPERFASLLNGEEAGSKIIVDLGVPADVSEETVRQFGFTYIAIEHLREMASRNMDFRRREIERAHLVLSSHLEEVTSRYRQRILERAMRDVPTEIKNIRRVAVDQIFRKELEGLDPEARDLMDRMMQYMEKRCIGIPMKAAREAFIQ